MQDSKFLNGLVAVIASALLVAASPSNLQAATGKPNILVIFGDDI